jgi:hypothetical protein
VYSIKKKIQLKRIHYGERMKVGSYLEDLV